MNRFGNPATVHPRCARGLPFQTSASAFPPRPWTSRPTGIAVTWKPAPAASPAGPRRRALRAARAAPRPLADLRHGVGHELDVVARKRRVPAVGRQDALAAD